MRILPPIAHTGRVVATAAILPGQTAVTITITPLVAGVPADVGLDVAIEQSQDGNTWWPLGGFTVRDVVAAMATLGRDGLPRTAITATFTEQIYRDDVVTKMGFNTKRSIPTDTAQLYHQLALAPMMRVTIDSANFNAQGVRVSDASLTYAVDVTLADVLPPLILLGHHSASLLGTFTGASSNSVTSLTTSSRTTTAGSLITGGGGAWTTTAATSATVSDNKSNIFTDIERTIGASVRVTLGYNVAGTRGAAHTVTAAFSGGSTPYNISVTAQEWDGIAVSPEILSNTATSTSAAPSVSKAVNASSLAVGLVAYDGAATTIAPNGATEASEQDESNVSQDQNVSYKVAQTGTPSIDWTLGASKVWGAVIITFTEAVTAAAPNILLYTEQFDQTSEWTAADFLTITPNARMPPNTVATSNAGKADTLTDANVTSQCELIGAYHNVTSDGSDWTASFYVAKDAVSTRYPLFLMEMANGTGILVCLSVDTVNGTVATASGLTPPTASGVVDVDANYWRVWMRHANNNTGNNAIRVALQPAHSTVLGGAADNSAQGSIDIWGFNLTNSSAVEDYQPNPAYVTGFTLCLSELQL